VNRGSEDSEKATTKVRRLYSMKYAVRREAAYDSDSHHMIRCLSINMSGRPLKTLMIVYDGVTPPITLSVSRTGNLRKIKRSIRRRNLHALDRSPLASQFRTRIASRNLGVVPE
jgi:hypothetical protein